MTTNKMITLLVLGATLAATPVWAEEAPTAIRTVDLGKFSCKELMSGNDRARDIGFAYYQGFLAGKKNNMTLKLMDASDLTDRVKDYCLSNPKSTVMDAFAKSAM